jgi:hypothetical protein
LRKRSVSENRDIKRGREDVGERHGNEGKDKAVDTKLDARRKLHISTLLPQRLLSPFLRCLPCRPSHFNLLPSSHRQYRRERWGEER